MQETADESQHKLWVVERTWTMSELQPWMVQQEPQLEVEMQPLQEQQLQGDQHPQQEQEQRWYDGVAELESWVQMGHHSRQYAAAAPTTAAAPAEADITADPSRTKKHKQNKETPYTEEEWHSWILGQRYAEEMKPSEERMSHHALNSRECWWRVSAHSENDDLFQRFLFAHHKKWKNKNKWTEERWGFWLVGWFAELQAEKVRDHLERSDALRSQNAASNSGLSNFSLGPCSSDQQPAATTAAAAADADPPEAPTLEQLIQAERKATIRVQTAQKILEDLRKAIKMHQIQQDDEAEIVQALTRFSLTGDAEPPPKRTRAAEDESQDLGR